MKSKPAGSVPFAMLALPVLLGGCVTSEPLLSRKGGVAAAELTTEPLLSLGGANSLLEQHIEDSDAAYLGGIIPVKRQQHDPAQPVGKGTRLFVDGHLRGTIPLAGNLAKPGPHTLRLEIPGWQPYTLKLANPVRLPVGKGEVESWPPVFVNCQSGEIDTAPKLPSLDPYQASAGGNPNNAFKVGADPMFIVTTADKRERGWSKLGDMQPAAVPR